jgi:hypothetical protein
MANPIVRLDKIGADNHIVSITCESDLANGTVVALGVLNSDGESYTVAAPADVTADAMVFHASVPMNYEVGTFEEDYILKAGKVGRGYILKKGDIVTITDDGITNATTKDQYVIPANSATKMTASATVGTSTLVFKVIEKTTLYGNAASTLQVVKA